MSWIHKTAKRVTTSPLLARAIPLIATLLIVAVTAYLDRPISMADNPDLDLWIKQQAEIVICLVGALLIGCGSIFLSEPILHTYKAFKKIPPFAPTVASALIILGLIWFSADIILLVAVSLFAAAAIIGGGADVHKHKINRVLPALIAFLEACPLLIVATFAGASTIGQYTSTSPDAVFAAGIMLGFGFGIGGIATIFALVAALKSRASLHSAVAFGTHLSLLVILGIELLLLFNQGNLPFTLPNKFFIGDNPFSLLLLSSISALCILQVVYTLMHKKSHLSPLRATILAASAVCGTFWAYFAQTQIEWAPFSLWTIMLASTALPLTMLYLIEMFFVYADHK